MTKNNFDFSKDFSSAARDVKEDYEPSELSNPIPWPFIAIALTLAIYGIFTLYLDARGTAHGEVAQLSRSHNNGEVHSHSNSSRPQDPQKSEAKTSAVRAASLFHSYCATCHQTNGAGVRGAIPPLDGTSLVNADSQALIAIVLQGLSGPVQVNGESYNGTMPAFQASLGDEEIALILTHLRTSWTNSAAPVSPAKVAAVRKSLDKTIASPQADTDKRLNGVKASSSSGVRSEGSSESYLVSRHEEASLMEKKQ